MRRSRHEVEEELRRRIREGRYAPGVRLPPHRELLQDLGVSSATLQHAFDALVQQGYVEPRGIRGTFVASKLPHQSTVALVFPSEPTSPHWNRYWNITKRVAEGWSEGDVAFRAYHISDLSTDGHQRLCKDLADGALAGVVFVNNPWHIATSSIFHSTVPRVCIGSASDQDMTTFGYSLVRWSEDDIPRRIVTWLQAAGRRRLAALTPLTLREQQLATYAPLLREHGMTSRPEWWIGLSVEPEHAASARVITHLLMSGPEQQRPDCLLILDDNLVTHATGGILDAQIPLPDGITVVAMANFPSPVRAMMPCLRFGPDMEAILRLALVEIAHLAAGGKPRLANIPLVMRVT